MFTSTIPLRAKLLTIDLEKMSMNRIIIAKNKAELVKILVDDSIRKRPFQTYADTIVFAAGQGVKYKKQVL